MEGPGHRVRVDAGHEVADHRRGQGLPTFPGALTSGLGEQGEGEVGAAPVGPRSGVAGEGSGPLSGEGHAGAARGGSCRDRVQPMEVLTIGHSTRGLEELVRVLSHHGVELLVDVRRFPRSRRHPHFNRERLEETLPAAGIDYAWREALGGRRSFRKETEHTAWRVKGFAAYADHMGSREFVAAMEALLETARERRTAVMCAEVRPERCHRRLVSDWLTVRGVEVVHLIDETRSEPHRLPPFARVDGVRIVYDGVDEPAGEG